MCEALVKGSSPAGLDDLLATELSLSKEKVELIQKLDLSSYNL